MNLIGALNNWWHDKLNSLKLIKIVWAKNKKKRKKKIVLCWMPHRRCVSFSFRCAYVHIIALIHIGLFLFLPLSPSLSRSFSATFHLFGDVQLFLLYEKKSPQATVKAKMTDWLADQTLIQNDLSKINQWTVSFLIRQFIKPKAELFCS